MALTKLTDLQPLHVHSIGISTFDGSVSVGGTLTYEDVTNVDALGIGTFRTGIKVLAGGINVVGVVTATAFHGDGSALTGIAADKIFEGNTEVETIDTGSDGHIKLTTEGSERIRIDSAGRVGVGTIAPSSFHANADNFVIMGDNAHVGMTLMTTNGGLDSTIAFADGTSGGTELQGAVIYQHNGDIMRFLVNQSERLRITSQGAIGLGGANYGTSGQVLTSGGSSGATTWSTISGTTINGNTDDYIITASGTANTLNGESNLIFTGSRLGINPSGGSITDIPATSHDTVVIGNSSATAGGITLEGASGSGNLAYQMYKQGGQPCARFMYEHSSNSVRFDSATGGSPGSGEALRMRLHPDGDVEIADGDLIIGTSGHGIDFGATANGGTGTPNEIFDDYEEGSWTPAIEGLSNTPSFHNLGGNYTKIGNRVFLQCHIQINGSNKPQFSNQSAAFKISGLPFSGSGIAGGGYFGAHGVCVWQQLQWVGGSYSSYGHGDDTQLSPGIVDGGTRITLQTCGQGIYYTGQLLNKALHNNYAPNIEFDMNYRTAT